MKELLAISWEMPPLTGPRAVQVTRSLVALGTLGWRSRTVCFSPGSDRYHQDQGQSVERLSNGTATLVKVPSPEEWFVFRALWRMVPPLKHLPDEKRVWMPGALRAARAALDQQPADVLISFAQPWSDHLIGLQLKRERGVPWVAHFSDPWVDSPYHRVGKIARSRALGWEREVIAEADRVVFVNEYTRDRTMAKYPAEWLSKCAVVPQGHDGDVAAAEPPGAAERPLRIVYTGRFYDGIRTPESFLNGLAAVHRESPLTGRLSVTFVGAAMSGYSMLADRLGLNSVVTFTGRVSPRQAMHEAASAGALLLIDGPSSDGPSLFLPSKLIDYLPRRRPIIGITPLKGPSADLLNEMGYPVIDPGNHAALVELVRQLAFGAPLTLSPQHDAIAGRYHINATTRRLAAVLDAACRT